MALNVNMVIQKLQTLLLEEADFLSKVPAKVNWAANELKRLQFQLKDVETQWAKGDQRLKDWLREVINVAYDIEDNIMTYKYIIEKQSMKVLFLDPIPTPAGSITLHRVGVELQKIEVNIKKLFENKVAYGIADCVATGSTGEESSDVSCENGSNSSVLSDDEGIGFVKEKDDLIVRLLDPANQRRNVVALVGMAGLGKTTLARRIYDDPKVKRHFAIRCWVLVSRNYTASELMRNILKQVLGIEKEQRKSKTVEERGNKVLKKGDEVFGSLTSEDLDKIDASEASEMVKQLLQRKRYLLVLDDVRADDVWDSLDGAFPDCGNGSQILLTTRNIDVANSADPWSIPHKLRFLDDDESWELVRAKVFPENREVEIHIHSDLEDLGRKLARKCSGLPIALVVLGAILLKKERTRNAWLELTENIDWESIRAGKKLFDLVAVSYNELPHEYLKSCLLYIASFPEGSVISVSKLIQLWITEGFIPNRPRETMEETARGCLELLIERSMVQVGERSITQGSIKTIRMHNLLRDWCVSKARIVGFLNACGSHFDLYTPSDAIPSRRVAIRNYIIGTELSDNYPTLRTLLLSGISTGGSFCGLKALRVVDMEGAKELHNLPREIGDLIHLKYLGLRNTGIRSLPSSVKHVWSLQSLDLRGTFVKEMPNSVWECQTLRHLYSSRFESSRPESINGFKNIHTLDFANAGKWLQKASKEVGSAPNMRKLRIDGIKNEHWESLLKLLGKLPRLKTLSLGVFCPMPLVVFSTVSGNEHLRAIRLRGLADIHQKLPDSSLFPRNLAKLVLDCFTLQQDPLPTLGQLPNLVVLRLGPCSYKGETMHCSAGSFRQLQHMVLYLLEHLRRWEIDAGAMPSLKKLHIGGLERLKTVPDGLRHIRTLEELKFADMSKEFMARIQHGEGEDWSRIDHVISVRACHNSYFANVFD